MLLETIITIKGKNQNKLREEDLQEIQRVYENYETVDKYSYVASAEEIKDNDYNLNIPRICRYF